jgi:hypothetical protein
MFVMTLALVMAAPNPAMLTAPRKAYVACLRDFETKSVAAKMSAADYSTAIQSACQAQSGALMNALVTFDVSMGTKRATAESNAKMDVQDYWTESKERFADKVGN